MCGYNCNVFNILEWGMLSKLIDYSIAYDLSLIDLFYEDVTSFNSDAIFMLT